MSFVIISGSLILNGNLTCNGDITVTPTGTVTPIPDPDLMKSFYSYQTNSYITANGQGRSITSTAGNVIVQGVIDGDGQGFTSDRGPGANSLLTDNLDNILTGYGATHAGVGSINMAGAPSPKPVYGFYESPVSLGSGSGFYHDPQVFTGEDTKGGGAIKIVARSGKVEIDGLITMNGQDGAHAGGASGGSIWLVGWFLAGSGALSASGGISHLAQNGGPGGGGYISLWYEQSNSFSGVTTVDGGDPGKVFVKKIEPVLEERFTGHIWNTKWWASPINNVTLNNTVSLVSPQDDYAFPSVTSLFNVSGKNITASIDYIPTGTEISSYNAEFLLYADARNWAGIAKRFDGVFGISSVNGIISASGVPLDNTNISMRLVKLDTTFMFQYYDAISTPQTIYSDVLPGLANKKFNVLLELDKPADSTFIQQQRITPLDISNGFLWLDGTPSDQTSVALNVIGGVPQYYGTDFHVSGDHLIFDSSLVSIIEPGDILRTIYGTAQMTGAFMDATFDSLRITEGVIGNAETTEPVLYVDPDFGSDSSDGRQLSPLQNLFVATAWSKRGGTVVLYDGTYSPTYVARKDITIRGAEGATATITSQLSQDTTGSGWENNALSFYGCQGMVENLQIVDSTVGIRVENADLFTISRNFIHDVSTAVSFVKSDPLMARNKIYNADVGFDFTSCQNVTVYSNVIYDSGVGVNASETDLRVVGNTIDGCDTAISIDASSNGIVSSNNLTDCNTGFIASSDSSMRSYFNNYFNDLNDYSRTPDDASGDMVQNPLYVNRFGPPALKDFHLNAASPNIEAGQVTFDQNLYDFDHVNRDNTASIGAYEFVDGTHVGDYFVTGSGDDFRNRGGMGDPFRTLDKAMLFSDATIQIDGGHYDSFYLKLAQDAVVLNNPVFLYSQNLNHTVVYQTLSSQNIVDGFIDLALFINPEDTSNFALNAVGGPSQEYGSDFIIEQDNFFAKSKLSWKGLALDGLLDAGDSLRMIFKEGAQRKLSNLILHGHYSNVEKERAIFVSTSGSDSTVFGGDGTNSGGNGSMELPYRTINAALSDSSAGDYIVAMAGEYPIFNGLNDRALVAGIDRTAVPTASNMHYIEDLFDPNNFTAFGTTQADPTSWTFNYSGESFAGIGGGFLNFTFDGTHTASATATYQVVNDFEISATLRNALDPVRFMATGGDNTISFSLNSTSYTAEVTTGGVTYTNLGSIDADGLSSNRVMTEYISVDANDVRNKFVALSFVPEPDCSNVAVNVVGGVPQNYGADFILEDSKIKWNGLGLDGDIQPGDVLRITYLDRNLSGPIRACLSLTGDFFRVKFFDTSWHTAMIRNMVGSYIGPWSISFVMDTPSNLSHSCIFGKGYVSEFVAIGESFENTDLDEVLTFKTEHRNLNLYSPS